MALSIFDRYGGFATIRRVVSAFYDKVLDSDVISHHFEEVEMRRLVDHQARFISAVTGGPASYSDDHLAHVHRRLGITSEEFEEMAALLEETLEDFDFERQDIEVVLGEIRGRRAVIVSSP